MKKKPGLLSVGVAAVIAGCGGGSPSGALPARIGPPNSNSGPMVTTSLRVEIPARGTKTARRRSPKLIPPGGTTLGVRVLAAPVPNPTPTEAVFTLPAPGPQPTSITVQVSAPLSTDTFVASVYDSSHNMLATGSSTPTAVSLTGTPAVAVSMLGVASGVQYTVTGSTPASWRVLENLAVAQTTTVDAQPVDADNNIIPGTLAAPAALTTTGGATLSKSSIITDTSVTATFPSDTVGSGLMTSPLALNAGTSALNAAVDADYYIFANDQDGAVHVIDGLAQKQVGPSLSGPMFGNMAALSGCATGAFAIDGYYSPGLGSVYSIAAPTTLNPTPSPVATSLPGAILSSNPISQAAAGDSHCNAFYNDATSGNVTKLSGFDSTIVATSSFATGIPGFIPLKSIGGNLISAQPGQTPPFMQFFALSVPEATGGAASSSTVFNWTNGVTEVVAGGSGNSVFLVSSTCSAQPILQPVSGGSMISLSQFTTVVGATEATDGTIYLAGPSSAVGNAATLAYGAVGSIGTAPTIGLGGTAVDVAVTPDQQYVCVLESPTSGSGQIEFFRRTPTPSLVATVPLSTSAGPLTFSIGP